MKINIHKKYVLFILVVLMVPLLLIGEYSVFAHQYLGNGMKSIQVNASYGTTVQFITNNTLQYPDFSITLVGTKSTKHKYTDEQQTAYIDQLREWFRAHNTPFTDEVERGYRENVQSYITTDFLFDIKYGSEKKNITLISVWEGVGKTSASGTIEMREHKYYISITGLPAGEGKAPNGAEGSIVEQVVK